MHHLCKYLSEHYDYTELTELYRQVLSLFSPCYVTKKNIHPESCLERGKRVPRVLSLPREPETLETRLDRGCLPLHAI